MASKQKKNKGGQSGGLPVVPMIATLLVIAVGIGAGLLIWSQSGDSGAGGIKLPDYVTSAGNSRLEKAYQVALDMPEDLAQVPCYCGCNADGHTSNLDCFIKERNGDNVLFDDHAAY